MWDSARQFPMQLFLSQLTALTGWLANSSGQASLLIGLVVFVGWLGRNYLSPRVRYALWLLVVGRLLLPVSVESGVSIFNLATVSPAEVFRAVGTAAKSPATQAGAEYTPAPTAPAASAPASIAAIGVPTDTSPLATATVTAPPVNSGASRLAPEVGRALPWTAALSLLWLAGVIFLLARVVWIPLRLNARLARHETEPPPAVFEVLEEAKRLSGVNQVLPVIQSRAVESPALLGFIRPWLLLPHGLVESFTPQELRLVFLHELAHLKRRDIAVNWLATLLQILHWPNPLVWYAFARMRADRELACDELALSFARREENKAYGTAMIKLLEGFARPTALPGLVGILEDQTQMQKRITMIARFKQMTPWSAAAVGLVLVLGCVTLTDAQTEKIASPIGPALALRRVPQAKFPGSSGARCVSPDGRYFVYYGGGDSNPTVSLFDTETQLVQKLAPANLGVCFSGGSRQIALINGNRQNGAELSVLNFDGSVARTVAKFTQKNLDYIWLHAWAPDGSQFAVVTKKDKVCSVALVDATSGAVRGLRETGTHEPDHLCFSPDGRWLAYDVAVDDKGFNTDVFVVDVTSGSESVLVSHKAADHLMGWSPTSDAVLFTSNRSGSHDAWMISWVAGRVVGGPMLVKKDMGEPEPIGFTKKGAFYFSHREWVQDVFTLTLDAKTGHAAGEPTKAIDRFEGTNSAASWSPDGKKLAYSSRRPPFEIRVLDIETQEDRLVVEGLYGPKWSPDGKSLLCFSQWDGDEKRLYIVDLASGASTVIDDGKPAKSLFRSYQWAPDGHSIYYQYELERNVAQIVRRELTTSKEQEIQRVENGGFFAVSPDGRALVFRKNYNLYLVPVAGGEPKLLLEVPKGRYTPGWDMFTWSADGRAVFVGIWEINRQAEQLSDSIKSELVRVPIDGGKPETVIAVPRVRYPHVHPDGSKITFSAGQPRLELWVMENFFPGAKLVAK